MNRLFLTAIIGEMCIEYTTTLKVGRYSPFKLFKQEMSKTGAIFTGNKIACILSAITIQQANKLPVHPLAVKAIDKMLNENILNRIYSDITTRTLTAVYN